MALLKNELWLTGESYAGKYVPSVAAAILADGAEPKLPLAGLAIGNGACANRLPSDESERFACSQG